MPYITLQGHADAPLGDSLFWKTDTSEFVQVINLEDAAAMKGITFVGRGDAFLNAKNVHAGGTALGFDVDVYRVGPKDWTPGERPGIRTLLDRVLDVFKLVTTKEIPFEGLIPEQQRLFALAMEAAFTGGGFDGGPSEAFHVVDKSAYTEKELEELEDHIYRGDMILSDNPETTVLEILERWGLTWFPMDA